MATPAQERRARSLSGIPAKTPNEPLWRRVLDSGWTWGLATLLVCGFLFMWDTYRLLHLDRPAGDGVHYIPGITNEAFVLSLKYALPTALFWIVLLLWLDRFRPSGPVLWTMAFVWGAAVSTWISLYLNTWIGELMLVTASDNDPAAGARPAIYSAPYVEEFAKATILFILAVLIRYRIVGIIQAAVLAGLSAAGFAFTENILYYARAYNFASLTIDTGDPLEALRQLFLLRGVFTAFGHLMFTSFTAIGLGIAVRTRSKLVRVVAPLAGFGLAIAGHMAFNASASAGAGLLTMALAGWAVTLGLAGFMIAQLFREGRRIRARLTDYVRMGWLKPRDPIVYSSLIRRTRMTLVAIMQPRRFIPTMKMMRSMTELAYLRDSMVVGIVGSIGDERATELLHTIAELRTYAVSDTVGERLRFSLSTTSAAPVFAPPIAAASAH